MFMPREETKFEQDSEILELNMANITHELSELVVHTAPVTATSGYIQPVEQDENLHAASGANLANNASRLIVPIQEHAYFSNADELRCSFEAFYRKSTENILQPRPESRNESEMGAIRKQRSRSFDVGAMPRQFSTGTCYKRRASTTDADQHEALLCAAIDERRHDMLYACPQTSARRTGVRRKFPRTETSHHIDYDSIVIDLRAIGLSIEKESNDVMRIFGVLRKFHYYINDVVPTQGEADLTDYPSEFVKPTPMMPCTMNVQSQIKHAIHKSNAFCYRLVEKLDTYKLADRDKYVECSRSLFILRKMIKQLEPFKTAEFEHKYGVFVNSFGAAQAKNLEILLTQIMGKIRECNIYIEVYMWNVKKNMETTGLPSIETLKKAIAIAGALLNDNPTTTLKTNDEPASDKAIKSKEDNEAVNLRGHDGNGGGIAGAAFIPAPYFTARAMRFIGI